MRRSFDDKRKMDNKKLRAMKKKIRDIERRMRMENEVMTCYTAPLLFDIRCAMNKSCGPDVVFRQCMNIITKYSNRRSIPIKQVVMNVALDHMARLDDDNPVKKTLRYKYGLCECCGRWQTDSNRPCLYCGDDYCFCDTRIWTCYCSDSDDDSYTDDSDSFDDY